MTDRRQRVRQYLRQHPKLRDGAFLLQNCIAAVSPKVPQESVGDDDPRYFLSALVRAKNEGRFLPEWIAYHHLIGVDHFYVYDNGSDDGTGQVLQPFVAAGLLTLLSWPYRPISPGAEAHFLKNHGHQSEWVAFLDADEFVVEGYSGNLVETLKRTTNWPAIALNWRYFGSSYQNLIPRGLILDKFTLANAALNRHVKVIARVREIHRLRNSHNFYYRRGRLAHTPTGKRVLASFSDPSRVSPSSLRINHYVYRSREDAIKKVQRGFVEDQGRLDKARNSRQVDREFGENNEVEVRIPDSILCEVRAFLCALGYDEGYFV